MSRYANLADWIADTIRAHDPPRDYDDRPVNDADFLARDIVDALEQAAEDPTDAGAGFVRELLAKVEPETVH